MVRSDSAVVLAYRCLVFLATTGMALGNPGVQMRMSERGLNYVNALAEAAIKAELQALKIPDQADHDGHLSWSLTNIQVVNVAGPSSQLTFNPTVNGLTWTLSQFAINLHSDWHVKYKHAWIKISDHGSLKVSMSDVSMTVSAGLGQKDGRPSISSNSCGVHIGSINIDVHGTLGKILHLFKGVVEKRVRHLLEKRICDIVNKEINEDAERHLSNMKVYISIDNRFLLDYGLIAAPVITSNFIQTLHKGEVYWKADMKECPFSAEGIPEWSESTSMLYLWLTEYTANTFAYQAHNHGYLQYTLTKDNLSKEKAGYLNTTCSSVCVGSIIKEISHAYPNSWVELIIKSSAVPTVSITSQNITADARADVELVAHTPDGSTHYLLTLSVSLALTVQASINNEKLVTTVVSHSFDVSLVKSDIGNINIKKVKIFIDGILAFAIIPQLNKIGEKGVDLPVTADMQFLNTKLVLQKGLLLMSTDVQYKGKLMFLPELH